VNCSGEKGPSPAPTNVENPAGGSIAHRGKHLFLDGDADLEFEFAEYIAALPARTGSFSRMAPSARVGKSGLRGDLRQPTRDLEAETKRRGGFRQKNLYITRNPPYSV